MDCCGYAWRASQNLEFEAKTSVPDPKMTLISRARPSLGATRRKSQAPARAHTTQLAASKTGSVRQLSWRHCWGPQPQRLPIDSAGELLSCAQPAPELMQRGPAARFAAAGARPVVGRSPAETANS